MKLLSGHKNYLIRLYLKNFFIVTLIFASLIFVLNVLEEVSFFNNLNLGIYYPLLFTFLNVPSIIFQIFPFIFLITTQLFFINLFNKNELILLKNYGVTNFDIIKIIAYLTFVLGIIIIIAFHTFSSSLKHNYLNFKNNFTDDNKYLAVINEEGLWIKDEFEDTINIINAEIIDKNILKNISINQLDNNFTLVNTIIADTADIKEKNWVINNAKEYDDTGKIVKKETMLFKSNFDYLKVNNLFSNLSSLNLLQLKNQYNDYKSLGYSTLDVESELHKILSMPVYFIIMMLIGSILMMNVKYNKSKIFNIILGIILSVFIYYLNYVFNIMGINERIPVFLSVWFPIFILSLFSTIGLIKINEK